VNAATIAIITALLTFGGGMAGLLYDKLLPEHHVSDETRALINRVTGLVATMSALVLGLLIASANTFYNSQKSDLEVLSGRVIALDSMLREYGPDAQPIRELLKATATRAYQHTWNSPRAAERLATIAEMRAGWGAIGRQIDVVRPTIDAQKSLQSKAADLIASIQDLRLGTRLQIDNSVTWPFLSILVSWTALLFFGFGLLARLNTAAVFTLAIGALSVASAIFLILELDAPYSGMLRLPPTPILQAIDALGK
jgi:hypothetical protein